MNSLFYLLEIDIDIHLYKSGLTCLVTAFVVAMICIPPLLFFIRKYNLFDKPGFRKIHTIPVPTMGGIAVIGGMVLSLILWYPFTFDVFNICFFLSLSILFALGIMDDLHDLPARYKFITQLGLATLIALSGVRITSFNGLFGVEELPLFTQYTITIITIVGITNAFNLIDGIDGLAGGLGFMSLAALGIFLTQSNDINAALIAFALAGGILSFLYFNFNPAKIFMGDTGSLALGFIISVLCIRLLNAGNFAIQPLLQHTPVFILSIVLIPVFDAVRVFSIRIWRGDSPFTPDKMHIHHLLTNAGISHGSSAILIYALHAFILIEVYWLRNMKQEIILLFLLVFMLFIIMVFKKIKIVMKIFGLKTFGVLQKSD